MTRKDIFPKLGEMVPLRPMFERFKVWTLLCSSSQVTPTQLHIEEEVDQILANMSLGSDVMSDLNARRANSSVVMFCLFAAKQATKQCSEREKRKRLDNRFTIFGSVWMRDEAMDLRYILLYIYTSMLLRRRIRIP
jgi:hypothetical protein